MADHHYVPRFYLKNFAFNADKHKDKPKVFSMIKEGVILDEPNNVEDICKKKNYNTPQQETRQSQFESKHARVLREFINTPNPETFNKSRDFVEFVCFMMGNNIHIRTGMNLSLREKLYDYMIKEEFPAEIISMDIGYRGQLDNSIGYANCVFNEFQSWKFAWHWPIDGKNAFITSDSPVSILNPNNIFAPEATSVGIKNLRVNFGEDKPISKDKMAMAVELDFTFDGISFGQDVIMIFPVTPHMCLLGFSDSERHARFMDRPLGKKNNSISTINLVIHNQCNRAVYSYSKDVLEVTQVNKPRFLNHCQRHGYPPSFDAGIG